MGERIGEAGRLTESRLTKKLGGRQKPNSGALAGAKGDIEAGTTLLECKSTTARSMKLEHAWLGKIAKEARDAGKTPAIAINFTHGDGRPVPNGEWVLVRLIDFREKFLGDGG